MVERLWSPGEIKCTHSIKRNSHSTLFSLLMLIQFCTFRSATYTQLKIQFKHHDILKYSAFIDQIDWCDKGCSYMLLKTGHPLLIWGLMFPLVQIQAKTKAVHTWSSSFVQGPFFIEGSRTHVQR